MDKLEWYKTLIKNFINYYVEISNRKPDPNVSELAIFDDERGHYQWVALGWENDERAFYTRLYVRIHDGKIWIEEDWTEDGIATELVREGVPREDIVLAFHPPELRHLTEFAAA
jgi:hypothetical protein